MKNQILYLSLSALLVACGGADKKAELEKLKKQKSELETKISVLEEEINAADTTKKKDTRPAVTTLALAPQVFKTYIEVQGRIDADENVSLSSEMPGTVTKINVKVGDEVTKGQVLAETDTRVVQQQIADLQTALDLAKQVYDKQKNLWDQKIGTEIQYLQAKTNKESLENKMSTMQEQLRMSKVISPINGTVDAVNIKVGQAIAPGIPAINVINFSNLKVKADVAESYAARVKPGNEAQILFPDMNDTAISKVSYAARAISPLTRTFGVEVWLDNKKEYHPNMVAKLKINDYQSAPNTIVVPVKYIQKGTLENFVMLAVNGKALKRVITIGKEYNGLAEIKSGLSEGELLITEGYDMLNDGDEINVSNK